MTTDFQRPAPGGAPPPAVEQPTARRPPSKELAQWAANPGSRQVLAAARGLVEAGRWGDRTRIPVALDASGRKDVGRLLGLPWQNANKPLTLGQLRAGVIAAGSDLNSLLTHVGGPLRDLRAERAEHQHSLARRRDVAAAALRAAGLPDAVVELLLVRRWLGNDGDGDLHDRAAQLAMLLGRLPADDVLLASLASELFGDPHALDRNRLLGRAGVRVLAAKAALARGDDPAAAVEQSATAAGWRITWSSAGVLCDRLSSTVLVLNLPLSGASNAALLLRTAAASAEPVWLTARALSGVVASCLATPEPIVRVCENPSIVETAADRLGVACPPLVCTYGRPSTAAWMLLERLSLSGTRFLISADRDNAGEGIARELLTRLPGAVPWLPDVPGLYEEDRLPALLSDLGAD